MEDNVRKGITPNINDFKFIHQNIESIISTAEDVRYAIEFGEGRTISIKPEPFDIENSLRDIATYVQTIEGRSSQAISIDYHFNISPRKVLVDSTMYRVFFHLFRNAIRFSPDHSRINIEVNLV